MVTALNQSNISFCHCHCKRRDSYTNIGNLLGLEKEANITLLVVTASCQAERIIAAEDKVTLQHGRQSQSGVKLNKMHHGRQFYTISEKFCRTMHQPAHDSTLASSIDLTIDS